MKKVLVTLWIVVCLMVVVVGTLLFINHVIVANPYRTFGNAIPWMLIVLPCFMAAWMRIGVLLHRVDQTDLKRELFRNTLEQPSELDSLGHKIGKRFGGKKHD